MIDVCCMQVNILEFQFDLQSTSVEKYFSLWIVFAFIPNAFLWALSRTFPACDDEIENANRFIMILEILIRSKQQI